MMYTYMLSNFGIQNVQGMMELNDNTFIQNFFKTGKKFVIF